MRKIFAGVLVAISLMLVVGNAGAASLQPTGSLGGGNTSPVGAPGVDLQPASSVGQGSTSDNLNSASVANLLGANPNATLGNSTFSNQEIMGEADPNSPAHSSTNWPEIGFFIALGLAIIIAGYWAFRRFWPAQIKARLLQK